VTGVDLFLSYWDSPAIAHTIASWEFEDGRHLAISIETRKERGETYSALLGFFRQFELYYVVADEHHGWWYSIGGTDARSKLMFRLVEVLLSARIAEATGREATPVLTVPVSR
jgi:hypothetical protein